MRAAKTCDERTFRGDSGVEDTMDVQPHNARLTLDATGTKVVARVVSRSDAGFQVAQTLPFLKLQGGLVDEEGRRGRLAGVTLDVHGDTPTLLLEVVYEDVRRRREPTIEFERPSDAPPRVVVVEGSVPPPPRTEAKPGLFGALGAWLRAALA
jgi:hypothetical protein